jgi:hypothetical protein
MTTLGVETEAPFGLDILKFVRHGARSEDQGASMHRQSSRTQADFQADSQKSTVVDAVIEFQQWGYPLHSGTPNGLWFRDQTDSADSTIDL